MKLKDFYNSYSQSYLKLNNSNKYHSYNELYLKLNEESNKWKEKQNILFIHMSQQDIDYLTFLADEHNEHNIYMSGFFLSKFSRKYYYEKIDNIYKSYEFFNFNYQPIFNKENWKLLKKLRNEIDLIILPCKIVTQNNFAYFRDLKLIRFLKSFFNAKIIGVGYDFCYINKKIKNNFNSIKLEKFISINVLNNGDK